MLTRKDAGTDMDRRLDRAVSKWLTAEGKSDHAGPRPAPTGIAGIRVLLERPGRTGTIRTLRIDGRPAFVYLCFNERGRPYAQGVGELPELAIADAFLRCVESI